MKLYRNVIGSDDDELTVESIILMPLFAQSFTDDVLAVIQHKEISRGELVTYSIEHFVDNVNYAEVYNLGYATFASYSECRQFNEIIYLVQSESR
jgi:hypothetical protein